MSSILNIDLMSVGIAVAANLILGFVIFFRNTKNATSVLFLLQTITLSIWGVANYLSYQPREPHISLLLVRLVMIFAVLQATVFLFLMKAFPKEHIGFSRIKTYCITTLSLIGVAIASSKYMFSSVKILQGEAPQPTVEPGIAIFGIITISFVLIGIGILIYKYIKSPDQKEQSQIRWIMVGIVSMFSLIIGLNFILPTYLNNTRFIPLSSVFTLPFVGFTAYAIIRHKFLNIKVFSTEILTFALAIVILFEVIVSDNYIALILRSGIFLLVLGVGILLIKSVVREVKQREQLERLNRELDEVNDKLKDLDNARAEFISIASHQLRTPPATIKWYLSALKSGDYGNMDAGVLQTITKAEITNNSQISLIDDLLNASRIERGKMEFLFEPGDLIEITQLTFEQLLPQATMHNLKLVWNKPHEALPQVIMDKEKLRQVINNFIDNAIKYTKTGSVTIDVIKENDMLGIKVTDTGKGFTPEIGPVLFEKYTRGKDSVMHASGLGLGLYVAKVIIEKHNGKIWANSPGEGMGSSFAFTIPIHNSIKANDVSMLDLTQAANNHK